VIRCTDVGGSITADAVIVYTQTGSVTADACIVGLTNKRVYEVEAEDRTYAVDSEDRTYTVGAESRTYTASPL